MIRFEFMDMNHHRWACLAFAWNEELHGNIIKSLARGERILFTDVSSLRGRASAIRLLGRLKEYEIVLVVLWDGYRDLAWLEAMKAIRQEAKKTAVLIVGDIGLSADGPYKIYRLFPPSFEECATRNVLRTVWKASPIASLQLLFSSCKAALIPVKNALLNWRGSLFLISSRNVLVFCGTVRPSHDQLLHIFRGSSISDMLDDVVACCASAAHKESDVLLAEMAALVERARAQVVDSAQDIQALYAMLNICVRNYVLTRLRRRNVTMFVNEYEYDRNFNPYSTPFYKSQIFLDFGSQIGFDAVYPRSAELRFYGKKWIDNRPIGSQIEWRRFMETEAYCRVVIESAYKRAEIEVQALSGNFVA